MIPFPVEPQFVDMVVRPAVDNVFGLVDIPRIADWIARRQRRTSCGSSKVIMVPRGGGLVIQIDFTIHGGIVNDDRMLAAVFDNIDRCPGNRRIRTAGLYIYFPEGAVRSVGVIGTFGNTISFQGHYKPGELFHIRDSIARIGNALEVAVVTEEPPGLPGL